MGVSIFHIPLIFADVKIPVIVVLTKYDLLVMEHLRACKKLSVPDKKVKPAKRTFSEVTKSSRSTFVPVSTRKDAQKEYGGPLIISITSLFPF
jgi:hypothetical protein